MIRAANGPVPRYGSPEWHALPETDRRRVAAVVVAAECWAQQLDFLEPRLRAEVAAGRAEHERIEAERFAEMAAGVRRLALVPTMAELWDRRGEPGNAQRARDHADAMRDGWYRPSSSDGAA
jgi:hypothetical protein